MVYGATVRCRCLQDGLAKPFPHDFEIELDEDGYWAPIGPWPNKNTPDAASREYWDKWSKVEEWVATACEHQDMELVDVVLANILGMQSFKHALRENALYFPVLLAELPVTNDGFVPPQISRKMLDEIELFEGLDIVQTKAFLADDERRAAVQEYLPSREGVFSHHGALGVDLGVDQNGFFVARRHQDDTDPAAEMLKKTYQIQQPREDLFRANVFEVSRLNRRTFQFADLQQPDNIFSISGDPVKRSAVFYLMDGESADVFKLSVGQKRRYRVTTKKIGPEFFEYILTSLRTVCEASIQTGNPIQWT